MAAIPIYGKKSLKKSSSPGPASSMKLGIYHRGLLSIIVCLNDGPGVTIIYFTAMSNMGSSIGKRKKNSE